MEGHNYSKLSGQSYGEWEGGGLGHMSISPFFPVKNKTKLLADGEKCGKCSDV